VDDFGVKFINETDVNHLIQTLKQDYEIEEDWEGTQYLGITLDWDYKKPNVHLSMPGFVEQALACFGHLMPKQLQHQPHKHTVPTYGVTIQYAKDDDVTNLLLKEEKKYIQQVLGTFLYYGRAVDSISSRHSALLLPPKPNPLRKPWQTSNYSLTTRRVIKTPSIPIKQVT